MESQRISELISEINTSPENSDFLSRVFTKVVKARRLRHEKDGDNLKKVCLEEYEELSRRADLTKIQESCSIRNVLRTRRLANLLIDDDGELDVSLLSTLIRHLTESLYSLGPNRQYDGKRQEQILHVVQSLKNNKELRILLRNLSKPYSHQHAEQIIRDTLQLSTKIIITDAHARRAALSAWMCYLRQNVGSCFATAPAIIVHEEQYALLLKDFNEILSTGRLKRTFGGVEHSVPLSVSWGGGDLRKLLLWQKRGDEERFNLWLSPGMIAAFEAANLLDRDDSTKHKVEKAKRLILDVLENCQRDLNGFLISPEEMIKAVLLRSLRLTEEDLHAFENRPRERIQSNLLIQPSSHPLGSGGKKQACLQFYERFEQGKIGFKSLADNALLKAWEFTLASFSEIKSGFTKWNLYSSLGLGSNEEHGIGSCLYQKIKQRLDECNAKVAERQSEYESLYSQVKYLESRIKNASTEKEAAWIRVEYQSKANEFYLLQELRDREHHKAQRFSELFQELIDHYDELFPRYFQEVYDADMHEVSVGPYDDSPAGFRLIYKHGRSNTSQWSRINNHNEFIEALVNFFTVTETEIIGASDFTGLEYDLSEIITAIVTHVKTNEFLETAFYRMAMAHGSSIVKNPLQHLDKIKKKPWVYTSGGAVQTLISCYYRREQQPTEVSRWVESPMELLVFLVDTAKRFPYRLMEEFIRNPKKSMLMHSPTHVFIFKPGLSPFREACQVDAYTYTWIRDHLVNPMKQFIDDIELDEEMMQFFVTIFLENVPPDFQYYFKEIFRSIHGPMTPSEFRNYLLTTISHDRGLQSMGSGVLSSDEIDRALYTHLPLFSGSDGQLKERLLAIFAELPELSAQREDLKAICEDYSERIGGRRIISAQGLQDIAKATLCLLTMQTASSFDYHARMSRIAQKLGYAMPAPIIFADTNWIKDEFAFLVNPGTRQLELWRVDYTGRTGSSMSSWEEWVNGTRKDLTWGVYTNPYEYSS